MMNITKTLGIFLTAIIFFAAIGSVAHANSLNLRVGVLIIGGTEFKVDEYYKAIKSTIKPASKAKLVIGNDIQTLYKKYWLKRGYIGEQEPQKSDLINFTAASGCDKVIVLIISDSMVDKHNNPSSREKDRISVQMDAYLCTSTDVIDVYSANCDEKSKTSSLRARLGAFKNCLKEISKSLNQEI
ncbi:MAG: hypothetical protein K6G55_07220 [Selenomonadaceae bacterium]|nr:hypothetical protein [Selenomonadaceae bacterium]